MIEVNILADTDYKEYEIFLANLSCSSCQLSMEWRNVINEIGNDEPYFLIAKEDHEIVGALPLYFYEHEFGNLLTTIAWHTISGIMGCEQSNYKEIYRALLDRSLVLAKELDCAAISINTNPFLEHQHFIIEYFEPDYMMENFIQYIDLAKIIDNEGNFTHPNYTRRTNLSRNLRKAKKFPIVISEQQPKDDIEKCFNLYRKRIEEVGAVSPPLPRDFFVAVQRNLVSKSKGKFLSAYYKEKIVSCSLFLIGKNMIDAYMMCMDSDYKELRVNYLLIQHMLKWARKKGYSIFNWMSSPRKHDGVYRWKEQWGSHELTCQYITRILGDISKWMNMDHQELRKAYRHHFLLPFNLLKNSTQKFTRKDEISTMLSDEL